MDKEQAIRTLCTIDVPVGNCALIDEEVHEAISMAIDALSQPSLPSDIDEAARMYRNFREECGIKDPMMLNEIEEAHYAGAEWMAGQGESIVAKIGLATEEICCMISEKTLDSLGVRNDDEIIVQIRKK